MCVCVCVAYVKGVCVIGLDGRRCIGMGIYEASNQIREMLFFCHLIDMSAERACVCETSLQANKSSLYTGTMCRTRFLAVELKKLHLILPTWQQDMPTLEVLHRLLISANVEGLRSREDISKGW